MNKLRTHLGVKLDRKMAEQGWRATQLRIGLQGVFEVQPVIQDYHQDNYGLDVNNDPGLGIAPPAANQGYVVRVPFESLDAACLLEGISVADALRVGDSSSDNNFVYWYIKLPEETQWTRYTVGVEPDTTNARYVVMLQLPPF